MTAACRLSEHERLYVRVDATVETGLGHFMRSLALAQAWCDEIGPATFVGRHAKIVAGDLERERIDRVELEHAHPDPRDIEATLDLVPTGAPVILDGYAFDYDFGARLARDRRLLVIDDMGQLPAYAGFALLNPNVDADGVAYPDAPERRLLGPRYALLRRSFRNAASAATRHPRARAGLRPETVLVTVGGADSANDTLRVLRALWASRARPGRIVAVVGPLNPHSESLARFASEHPGVDLGLPPFEMLEALRASDFVIASAGSVSAELALLGIPALLFAVADNQLAVGRALERERIAAFGGDLRVLEDAEMTAAIDEILVDDQRMDEMRINGPRLIDGRGAARTCAVMRRSSK